MKGAETTATTILLYLRTRYNNWPAVTSGELIATTACMGDPGLANALAHGDGGDDRTYE